MQNISLFITGVTGYIGGDFLYAVSQKHPNWHITALVRTKEKASQVVDAYPNVRIVIGDNESSDLIEAEVSKADIVYHFAGSADDEPSAKSISAALKRTGGTWIHTSGAMLLVRPNLSYELYGYDDGEDYDDWDGVHELVNLRDDAPHRGIDKIVLTTGSDTVKTAIVCPPTIYGPGRGPDNKTSMRKPSQPTCNTTHESYGVSRVEAKIKLLIGTTEAPQSAATMLRNKQGFIYGEGKNIWHQIHVQDLSDLYVALGEAAVKGGEPATWNQEGYYLAENGAFAWGDVLRAIAKDAHQKDYIPSIEMEKIDAAKAKGKYPMSVGTTSKGKSYRAKKLLGWTPFRPSLLDEVSNIVDTEAAKLGLVAKTMK